MQKEFINGIPYHLDKGSVYLANDSTSTLIGTYSEKRLSFHANHLVKLQEQLTLWRTQQLPRVRKPTAPSSRKSRNTKAGVTEVSDDDT
jgi:hypothetical protein